MPRTPGSSPRCWPDSAHGDLSASPKGTERGKGDAVARSTGLLAALETGELVRRGFLTDFEAQAVTWEAGQHQPDRVTAASSRSMCSATRSAPASMSCRLSTSNDAPARAGATAPAWMRRRVGGQ